MPDRAADWADFQELYAIEWQRIGCGICDSGRGALQGGLNFGVGLRKESESNDKEVHQELRGGPDRQRRAHPQAGEYRPEEEPGAEAGEAEHEDWESDPWNLK